MFALAHGTGCGMNASGPGWDNLNRVIMGYAAHPNVGAAVFVGLGCEMMQISRLRRALRKNPQHPKTGLGVRVDPIDDFFRQLTAAHNHHEAKVVAAAPKPSQPNAEHGSKCNSRNRREDGEQENDSSGIKVASTEKGNGHQSENPTASVPSLKVVFAEQPPSATPPSTPI